MHRPPCRVWREDPRAAAVLAPPAILAVAPAAPACAPALAVVPADVLQLCPLRTLLTELPCTRMCSTETHTCNYSWQVFQTCSAQLWHVVVVQILPAATHSGMFLQVCNMENTTSLAYGLSFSACVLQHAGSMELHSSHRRVCKLPKPGC